MLRGIQQHPDSAYRGHGSPRRAQRPAPTDTRDPSGVFRIKWPNGRGQTVSSRRTAFSPLRRRALARPRLPNWRRRIFKPAAAAARLGELGPYALRHSWTSLLLRSPEFTSDPARIARMAGPSLQTFYRLYAHEIEEYAGQATADPDAAIAKARLAASDQLSLVVWLRCPDGRALTHPGFHAGCSE